MARVVFSRVLRLRVFHGKSTTVEISSHWLSETLDRVLGFVLCYLQHYLTHVSFLSLLCDKENQCPVDFAENQAPSTSL